MTNNQIKYMIEVAQTGSINQAARNLFISQSALSNAIVSVEEEFGRKIFNRSSRGVTLTSFGKLFIAYIIPIHNQLSQLYAMRNTVPGGRVPTLNIISNGFYYISDIITSLGRRYASTGLRITLQEEYSGNMLEAIVNQTADLGVTRLWSCYRESNLEHYATAKMRYQPICELQVGVDISEKNPLYHANVESIAAEELAGFPQIMHESLDCGPYADILSRLKLPVSNVRYVVDSRAAIYEILDSTDGYVLNSRKPSLDGRCRSDIRDHRWRFIPLKDCAIRSEIGWLVRENSVLSPEAQEFIRLLQDYLVKDIVSVY